MRSSMIIHPQELSKDWIDRLADAGVDTLGIHPVGGAGAAHTLEEMLSQMQTQAYRDLIDYAHSRHLSVEYELHAAGYLMPRTLFDQHPDYFRVNAKGERSADCNFCVSNPKALQVFAQNAARLASSLYGSSHDFYFWMDDGYDLHCHCEKCRSLSASDQQLIAVNAMLSEIQKIYPDARMAYLAYVDSIAVPTKVQAAQGVFLEYAPFEKYTATGEDAPQRIAREREMLLPLLRFFGAQPPKVLEYWYDNSLFSKWKKPPKKFCLDQQGMVRDVADYKAQGFAFVATFACFLGEDYCQLYGKDDIDVAAFADCIA